jgi:raffinose/stachyose/melibiose transport system permease protein
MRESRREIAIGHAILVVAAIIALYPFVSILSLALSRPGEARGGLGLPTSLYFGNFVEAWTRGVFSSALVSSLIVAVLVVAGTVVLAVPAGFALGTVRSRGLTLVSALMLVGLVMPYEAMVIPLYNQFKAMGLIDTYAALILPQVALSLSFAVLWLRTSFAQIPSALSEAAAIDGASRARALWSIILPVGKPAILTLVTLLFLFTWNEFLLALVLVPGNKAVQTAPLALSFFAGNQRNSQPPVTAAAAVIVALPVLVAYIFMQRRFISGMLAGAVKE